MLLVNGARAAEALPPAECFRDGLPAVRCVAASSSLDARPMEKTISRRRGHPAVFVTVLDVLRPLLIAASACSMYRKLALYRSTVTVSPFGCSLAAE